MTQSWVINNQARSQPSEAMAYAVDNRRRIMGSSIFGGDEPPQRYSQPQSQISYQPPPQQSYNGGATSNLSNPGYVSAPLYSTQPLTMIPDFVSGECPPPPIEQVSFRSRSTMRPQIGGRRLDVQPNYEMQKLRDTLVSDSTAMSRRLRQIGQD